MRPILSSVSCGQPVATPRRNISAPALASSHSICAPAAARMRCTARITSGPMPSPAIAVTRVLVETMASMGQLHSGRYRSSAMQHKLAGAAWRCLSSTVACSERMASFFPETICQRCCDRGLTLARGQCRSASRRQSMLRLHNARQVRSSMADSATQDRTTPDTETLSLPVVAGLIRLFDIALLVLAGGLATVLVRLVYGQPSPGPLELATLAGSGATAICLARDGRLHASGAAIRGDPDAYADEASGDRGLLPDRLRVRPCITGRCRSASGRRVGRWSPPSSSSPHA